ncbi:MAG: RNA methyltransferase [Tannerella sp.]|jgi:TrmH family RNA methyltransferase|nr:RNA methyltransferase [Tannerella sp.]
MISKAKIRLIRSLEMKKQRDAHRLFVAEGNKLVADMTGVFECEWMLAATPWMAAQGHIPARELIVADEGDIRRASLLQHPQEDVLALFRLPAYDLGEADPAHQLILVLDGVRNPGNMGTLVRVADWFGIAHVVCSTDSADVFAPKAVQATMGALAHVAVHYADLEPYLGKYRDAPVYGTFTEGDNIYEKTLSPSGIIVMGNEGAGIRPSVEALVRERLCIPSYPAGRATSESLNVAVAAAVICSEFRRRTDA